jgi:hypothetical protein
MFFFQPVVRAMVGYQFARSPGIVIDLAGGLFGPSIVPIEPYLNASIGFSFDSAVPEATGSGNLDLDMADRFLNDRFILIPEKAAEVRIPMENLDTNSRLGLYEKYRQEAWKGILFNAVLPGVGSLLIGDTGSSLLIWGGFGVAVLAFGGVAAVGLNDPKGVNPASGAIQTVLILFSILDLGCSYGYGLFSPVPFVEKWNSQLRNSLMLQGSGFSLQPDGNKAVNAYAFHLDIYQFEF